MKAGRSPLGATGVVGVSSISRDATRAGTWVAFDSLSKLLDSCGASQGNRGLAFAGEWTEMSC